LVAASSITGRLEILGVTRNTTVGEIKHELCLRVGAKDLKLALCVVSHRDGKVRRSVLEDERASLEDLGVSRTSNYYWEASVNETTRRTE
jgi:hypothetical protein